MAIGCGRSDTSDTFPAADLAHMTWSEVISRARGTTVRYAMWAGDEARNRFYQGPATDALRQDLDIMLTIVPLGDTSDLVGKLVTEKAAGLRRGSVDLVWINGANFRTAKQAGVLWGPFVQALPNLQHFDPVAIQHDFGTSTDGLEAPYEQAQLVLGLRHGADHRPSCHVRGAALVDPRSPRALHLSGNSGLHGVVLRPPFPAAQRRSAALGVHRTLRCRPLRARIEAGHRVAARDEAVSLEKRRHVPGDARRARPAVRQRRDRFHDELFADVRVRPDRAR